MLIKTAKILLGLLLVPFCIGFTWQLVSLIFTVRYSPGAPYYFAAGGFVYLAAHLLFRKPVLTYVIGHELTHALFALLFGGSVKSIQVSNRGGRVLVTKSNFIITLAPYFFPLYTFIALLLYWLAHITHTDPVVNDILIFLSGATFVLHLMLTFIFLQTDQNDIHEHGAIFSYPLIYLFNVCFAAFLLKVLLTDNMEYLNYLVGGIIKSLAMLMVLFKKAWGLASSTWQ